MLRPTSRPQHPTDRPMSCIVERSTGKSREEPNGRSLDMNTALVALLADLRPLEAARS